MKKCSLLFISLMALFTFCFTSCENGKEDDALKGVWKCISTNAQFAPPPDFTKVDITYVFDGKGNYTYIIIDPEYGTRSAKGTYSRMENHSLVSLHGIFTTAEGIHKEYDADLWLITIKTPFTLNTVFYDVDITEHIPLAFEKQ